MKALTFSYSIDGGVTFSTEYTLDALEFWVDLNPEFETSGSESRRQGNNAKVCQKPVARLKGDIKLSWTNFDPADPAHGSSALDNWLFMQYWLCAGVRRIYFSGGSAHFVWSNFDAQDNTSYINVDNWDYDYTNAEDARTGRKIRSITIEISARDAQEVVVV